MKVQLFKVDTVSISETEKNAEKVFKLSNENVHTLTRVYSDGTCYKDIVGFRDIFKIIALDCMYRYQSSLVLDDDTIIFIGGDMATHFIEKCVCNNKKRIASSVA